MVSHNETQAVMAERVTKMLADLGYPPRRPINQTTVRAWANGTSAPRGPAIAALEAIVGIRSLDWCAPPDSTVAMVDDESDVEGAA